MNYKLFPAESDLMLCKNLLFIGILHRNTDSEIFSFMYDDFASDPDRIQNIIIYSAEQISSAKITISPWHRFCQARKRIPAVSDFRKLLFTPSIGREQ